MKFLSKNFNRKSGAGFTFVEVLIVMGIIAILATSIVVLLNPAKRFEAARDGQREVHLQTIYSAIERKMTVEGGWFIDEDCFALPDGAEEPEEGEEEEELKPIFKTIGIKRDPDDPSKPAPGYYDLFACLVPDYLVNPLYDPAGGNEEDTHYQIWQNPQTKYVTLLYEKEKSNDPPIIAGAEKYFVLRVPRVSTEKIKNITHTWADGGGDVLDDGGASVFERGVIWSEDKERLELDYVDMSTVFRSIDGSGTGVFDSRIHSLKIGTTYYVRAYARNKAGVGYCQEEPKSFDTLSGAPAVSTDEATNVTHNTAVIRGTILTIQFTPVTAYFCWGESENEVEQGCPNYREAAAGITTAPESFSKTIYLDNEGTYHFKACGIVGTDFRCGEVKNFEAKVGPPYVVTLSQGEYNIGPDYAVVKGQIVSDGGSEIEKLGFCYSTKMGENSCNYDPYSSGQCKDADSYNQATGYFSAEITGLEAGNKYNVCTFAANGKDMSRGEKVDFTTIKTPPKLETKIDTGRNPASPGSGVSGGIIISDGGDTITQKGVCWVLAPSIPDRITDNCTNDGGGKNDFTSNIPVYPGGLWTKDKYNVRAYAINEAKGTGWADNVEEISTDNSIKPKLTTIGPKEEDIYKDSVKNIGGDITDHGGAAIGGMGICYNTKEDFSGEGKCGPVTPNINLGKFYTDITGLYANTPYYIRAYAQNIVGINYGNTLFFRTKESDPPELEGGTILDGTGENWAKIGGNVKSTGGDLGTIRGVCYSPTGITNPTYMLEDGTNVICVDDGTFGQTGPFIIELKNLSVIDASGNKIIYYALVFARNNAGSVHGYPSVSFTLGRENGESCTDFPDGSRCQSGFCADGVCCNEACNDPDKPCQTCGQYSYAGKGQCGYVNSSAQDPRNKCNQGSTADDGCRSNNCSGNSYSCGIQISGDGGCPTCKTCTNAATIACKNYQNNTQDVGCNGTCQACQDGSCGVANVNSNPGNHCTIGTNADTGCRANYCAGGTATCAFYNSGERACPECKYCQGATSHKCVNRPNLTQDTVLPGICDGVKICNNGACVAGKYYLYITTNTYNGNLKGGYNTAREGANAKCVSETANKPSNCRGTPWAFISINSTDTIAQFSTISTLPWYWGKGTSVSSVIANDFNDLLSGAINYKASDIGYGGSYWTGSNQYGQLSASTCNAWSYSAAHSYSGRGGSTSYKSSYWLSVGSGYCTDSYGIPLLCVCLGI